MSACVGTVIPILLYHSVSETPAPGQEAFTVTPAAFREHVRAVCDSGRASLTVSELAAALRGDRPLPARPVLVTFDDGFADVRGAVGSLIHAGLKATVFVTSGWLGRASMLTEDGVRDLAAQGEGVEIGAHTVTHTRLDEIGVARAAGEITASRDALEQLVRGPVRSFAYPHGAYDRRVRGAVIDAGFGAAAGVKNALSHNEDDPYALARMTVTATTSTGRVEALLAGAGAPRAWARERTRTRGYRSVRRLRRRIGWAAP